MEIDELDLPLPPKRVEFDYWERRRKAYALRQKWKAKKGKRRVKATLASRFRTGLAFTIIALGAAILLWWLR